MKFSRLTAFVCSGLLLLAQAAYSQCTTLGQNPSTSFPVCGSSVFNQTDVPICGNRDVFVPGCTDGAQYSAKNPFWYKFTCFKSGTLSFAITPHDLGDDYDWQLYDITGKNPEEVFTNKDIIVTGNWSATFGKTGASASGVNRIECASDPKDNTPTFARSPNLIVGHDYLLLISHYTDSQSGYSLEFSGGSAVITDPLEPHLTSAASTCDGRQIRVKVNKKMKCSSLSAQGSEFSILPAVANVVGANSINCSAAFEFDEIVLTLSNPVPPGNYQLTLKPGSDANTILDICNRGIPLNEQIAFNYQPPQPITFDSVGRVGCAPDQLKVYFPKRINCSSLAVDGTDLRVNGPTPVVVTDVTGNCDADGMSSVITVQLAAAISTNGTYLLSLVTGSDGNTVVDECGQIAIPRNENFLTYDTVSARFTYTNEMGCRFDTLNFLHDGAHGVLNWDWNFNSSVRSTTPAFTIVFPAFSSNIIKLTVRNEVCTDSSTQTIELNNEVKAAFDAPSVVCPEDLFAPVNNSRGVVDVWNWTFGNRTASNLMTPTPQSFPNNNVEAFYNVKLKATNLALGCTDSISKQLRVLNNCYIAVPTAFTPNNDGRNDYLSPNNALKTENFHFRISNRWGQLVFESNDWTQKWDGKVKGIEQGSGVYVWFLNYTDKETKQKVFLKGTSTLIR